MDERTGDLRSGIEVEELGTSSAVAVTLLSPVSVSRAWAALTDPLHLQSWFTSFEGTWRPGATGRFDFGDGDFFELAIESVRAPTRLAYHWRFLGIGPHCRIEWTLQPTAGGTLIRVHDAQTGGRADSDVSAMRKGWYDFLQRLEGYLSTGRPTRYDWRHELDASIAITSSADTVARRLLWPPGLAEWLPFPLDGEAPTDDVADGVSGWRASPLAAEARSLRLEVSAPEWLAPTSAVVEVLDDGGAGALLTVHHDGWTAIGRHDGEPRQHRRTACARWVNALRAARAIVSGTQRREVTS